MNSRVRLEDNTFYSGTSGLVLPMSKASYPEEFQGKSRLAYYACLFNTVEINSTFYKLPRTSTIIKWDKSVADNFQFTFKLSKIVRHAKALNFSEKDVEHFMHTINHIGNKKGCVLIQLPPSLKTENINQLKKLLKKIAAHNTWKIAVEFRNNTWYNDEVYYLLTQHHVSLVIHDLPNSVTPFLKHATDFVYLRLHGTERGYRGNYSADLLSTYAGRIRRWMNEGKFVYCYFNNTLGNAFNNLQTLNSYLL